MSEENKADLETQIGQALARGYQADGNRDKELDSDLIMAMRAEVMSLILSLGGIAGYTIARIGEIAVAESDKYFEQFARLNSFIVKELPSEVRKGEATADCAIRLIHQNISSIRQNRLDDERIVGVGLDGNAPRSDPRYAIARPEGVLDADRGTGRTRNQIAAAERNAAFLFFNNNGAYARDLAKSITRSDVECYGIGYLKSDNIDKFLGWLGKHQQVIIDHAADLTPDMNNNLAKIEGRTGKPIVRWQAPRVAEQRIKERAPDPKLQADIIPWAITGTGLTIRDEHGQQLARMKMMTHDNTQGGRASAMQLMELLSRLIEQRSNETADILPQHRENTSARTSLARMEEAERIPGPGSAPRQVPPRMG